MKTQKHLASQFGMQGVFAYDRPPAHRIVQWGEYRMELNDLLRVAGIGLVIGFLHIFFEQTGRKEFSFFLFFIAYIYITAEMLRLLKIFFTEITEFFKWLSMSV
jgi:hypothetical protein